jgi:hypothetical protein
MHHMLAACTNNAPHNPCSYLVHQMFNQMSGAREIRHKQIVSNYIIIKHKVRVRFDVIEAKYMTVEHCHDLCMSFMSVLHTF